MWSTTSGNRVSKEPHKLRNRRMETTNQVGQWSRKVEEEDKEEDEEEVEE